MQRSQRTGGATCCKTQRQIILEPRHQTHTRRARLLEAGGKFTQKEFNDLLKKYDACPMCARKWSDIPLPKHKKVPWTADHIIPINPLPRQKQGSNDISNIQPLCFSCNSKKGNRV